MTYYLKVVGQGYVEKQTMMYDLEMTDNTNQVHKVRALGIETVTEEMTGICLDGVKKVFPWAPDHVYNCPGGEINLLIGQNYRDIQLWPVSPEHEANSGCVTRCSALDLCSQVTTLPSLRQEPRSPTMPG